MTARITELRVESFRGATNRAKLQIDSAKPFVVIFGENGTGKSTLVDALDLIANQRIGSLKDRSSASEKKHAPAIGKKCKDIKVTLCRGTDKWEGTYNGTKITVSPTDNRPKIEILRRSQLLKLVEAQPGKRYEVLQQFIDVSSVEGSERALEQAAKDANAELRTAIDGKHDAEEQLSSLWQSNGKPCSSWLAWAESKAGLNTTTLEQNIRSLNDLILAIQSFNTRLVDYESAVNEISQAQSELQKAQSELRSFQGAWSKQAPELISALEATTKLLDAGWQETACPVCQQGIEAADLRSRVADTLASMKSFKTLHEQEQKAGNVVQNASKAADTERGKLIKTALPLVTKAQATNCPEVVGLSLDLAHLTKLLQAPSISPTDLEALISACKTLVDLESTLQTPHHDLQRDRNQLHTIQSQYKTYKESDNSIDNADKIRRCLESAHAIVRDRRIIFIQQILNSVSQEVARLYDIIHPGEDAKPDRLELDPDKRGSLLQFAEFAGQKDVEPQGYFSDSHLDTLGFCCWMALAKRNVPQDTILVLDDVFTSVDMAHLDRIVQLLDAECAMFAQVFVFTHYRNWRDRYRFNQAAGGKAHLIELRHWTPIRGVTHNRTKLEVEEIAGIHASFAKDGSPAARQQLASRCGIMLEAILSHLSMQYRCSVPHTADGFYTLNDLLGACTKLAKVLQVQRLEKGHLDGSLTPLPVPQAVKSEFDALAETALAIRNQVGCHFNPSGASLSDREVEEFGKATIALVRGVVCEHCGEIPRSDKSLYRQCSCKRTRLLPAKL